MKLNKSVADPKPEMSKRKFLLIKVLMFALGTTNNIGFSTIINFQRQLSINLGNENYIEIILLTLSFLNFIGAIIYAFFFNHLGQKSKNLTRVFLSSCGLLIVYFSQF